MILPMPKRKPIGDTPKSCYCIDNKDLYLKVQLQCQQRQMILASSMLYTNISHKLVITPSIGYTYGCNKYVVIKIVVIKYFQYCSLYYILMVNIYPAINLFPSTNVQ